MDGSLGLHTGSLMFQMRSLLRWAIHRPVGAMGGVGVRFRLVPMSSETPCPCQSRGMIVDLYSLADLYLVDPASSHMLVPKTKPCMSELKP
jgi:hypothetical protein